MQYQVVPLNIDHLDRLFADQPESELVIQSRLAYLSPGSSALCLLEDGIPVFCGGIVSLQWHRGEAWILPNHFFRSHLKLCLKILRDQMPRLASLGKFRRVQATCLNGSSAKLFYVLGFDYEGTMKKFGPGGESCQMWARVFEVGI